MSTQSELDRVDQIKQRHEEELLGLDGVIGVGVGISTRTHKPCIKAYLKEPPARLHAAIPQQLDGVEVEVEEVGDVRAL